MRARLDSAGLIDIDDKLSAGERLDLADGETPVALTRERSCP